MKTKTLIKRIRELEKALEFYATTDNYWHRDPPEERNRICVDYGARARKALGIVSPLDSR